MKQSLQGIRILDLSRLLPGPYATQLLADLGAEVIKVERPPEGDYARMMPPYLTLDAERIEGAVFAQNNRGKKSIAFDFFHPHGCDILLRLCERADVLLESFRPGVMASAALNRQIRAHCNTRYSGTEKLQAAHYNQIKNGRPVCISRFARAMGLVQIVVCPYQT